MKFLPLPPPVRSFLKRKWTEWRSTILFAAFVLTPVKSSLADMNWVPSGSMNPTILEGDLVYVDKLAYDLRLPLTYQRIAKWQDPAKGDIVVFFSPKDDMRIVKRVVGTPGDVIELRNRTLYLNGKPLDYAPLPAAESAGLNPPLAARAVMAEEDLAGREHAVMAIPGFPGSPTSFPPITVPPGQYFIMGDNRDNSLDSRDYGMVERKRIIGKVSTVLASFDILDKYQPRTSRFMKSLR
ncbi:signal peptidase I [Luteolibacter flavescens]|uniref:Signal peptidase I n=1 Tax=Luteolibacter flavescens TaxID=1859460 RepID=A0ABT3FNF9_9BACT|nr:signal peptidase I [Luteolibacter flavescens]MCW1885106.1 signal peptidase I [Luteolibacter flavescens]